MNNREQFESWVSDNGKFQRALERKGDIYLLATINTQWEAWQAASKASEQQLAAVVAENAGLKSKAAELVHEASEVYSAYNATITEPDGDFMDMQTLQEMQCVETPATDAYLAEARAQGVEMLLASLPVHYTARADIEAFAAQLRQGAAL